METKRIAVIAGDGIGPEVVTEGIKVMNRAAQIDGTIQFDYTYFPWGCEYYTKHGKMLPDDGLEQLQAFDAIYLGAVGFPGVPDYISLRELLLVIRKKFDQYVNIRPVKLLKGIESPLRHGTEQTIDMLVIRENSEGEYAGAGEWLEKGTSQEKVLQTGIFTRKGVERIIRYAFEEARRQGGKSVTSISKANALNYSMVFWDEIFEEISNEYPEIPTHSYLVDAAAMFMVMDPGRFEIVVTSNLFGDILTDLGAAIAGGMGIAAGANVDPERRYPSMFEPIHGSAPDIAGQGIANPLAAIWSVSQMFDFFERPEMGAHILTTIEKLLAEKTILTPDFGGHATTEAVGTRLVELL